MLALNIMEKSMKDLLHALDYNQYAPPGFLIIEKLITNLLGTSELAFRLFPFICSIVSLFLFYKLCKKCLSGIAVPIAIGLFSVLISLLYYSSEAKQYSSDVLFMLILVLMSLRFKETGLNIFKTLFYGLLAAVIIWFSHTAIFVLLGEGLYLLIHSLLKKDYKRFSFTSVFCLMWFISFCIFYFKALTFTDSTKGLIIYWGNFYLPFPPFTASAIIIYKKIFGELSRFLTFDFFSAVCFLLGLTIIYKNKKETFYILLLPILVTVLAAAAHKYPIYERFILFLVPLIIMFIAEGAEWLRQKGSKITPILGIFLICLLFYKPLVFTRDNFTNPLTQEETRPVFRYIKEHLKPGDVIYISDPLQFSFKYYAKNYNFCNNYLIKQDREKIEEASCSKFNHKLFLGSAPNNTTKGFENIPREKRVWFVFSEKLSEDNTDKKFTLKYIDKIGVKTGFFGRPGVAAYLYNLSIRSNHQ